MSVDDRWFRVVEVPGGKPQKVPTAVHSKGSRYEVRWRDAAGEQHKRRFDTRAAADMWNAKQKVDPEVRLAQEGRTLTVDRMMATWLTTKQGLERNSVEACEYATGQVLKEFTGRLAAGLKASEIQAWTARAHPGESARRRSLAALRAAYTLAIADGLQMADPTRNAALPRVEREGMRFLTWEELGQLAEESGLYGPLVWMLGTCGLRIGEAVALDQRDLDRKRRRLWVRKSKTHKPRDVPVMPEVLALLPTEDGPLFRGERGGRLSARWWRAKRFGPAVKAAGLAPLRPHDLRHTAASLAIAAGADAKVVQQMLGHESGAMTMDLYTHLFDEQLDRVAKKMAKRAKKVEAFKPRLRLVQ